jgi:hypothetical protein
VRRGLSGIVFAYAALFTSGAAAAQSTGVDTATRAKLVATSDTARATTKLDPVHVVDKAPDIHKFDHTGFDDRLARRGFGYFLTDKAIEPMHAQSMARVFAIVPGITVVPSVYGNRIVSHGINARFENCEPAIYLDGSLVFDGASIISNVVRPAEFRGMEVYLRVGSAPPPYDREPCGSILIWTKNPDAGRRPPPRDSTP